ncbi:hypothetical protein [Wolbachia endosymbiont (group A) of Barypeithes pellucidus]|uniref:hypothetical protein n=1 Tax=Wolbachia endosymbiont (group A) of Barypeithes pellucidus TaxID=3139322 RepID=UPI003CCACDF9
MPTNSDEQRKISLEELESAVVDMLLCRYEHKLKRYESGRGVAELSKKNTDIIDKYIECVGKPSEQFIETINETEIRYLLIFDELTPDTIEKYVNEGKIDILRGYIKSIGSYVEYISKILEKCGSSDGTEIGRRLLARKLERIEEASKPQTEVKIKTSIYKTCCALSGSAIIGAAIAYLAGAATLAPAIVAVVVFIAAAVVGALVGYGIGKFCEKVSEEKQNDPDMSMCTAIKNVLTPECLKSQSQVHP